MRLVVIITLLVAFCIPTFADKPRIVFDTGITGDVDDVLALSMCHTLADRGACELLVGIASNIANRRCVSLRTLNALAGQSVRSAGALSSAIRSGRVQRPRHEGTVNLQ